MLMLMAINTTVRQWGRWPAPRVVIWSASHLHEPLPVRLLVDLVPGLLGLVDVVHVQTLQLPGAAAAALGLVLLALLVEALAHL